MLQKNILLLLLSILSLTLSAQMWNGTDSLYGNEWINYDQSYYKVAVTEDGMHRLSRSALEAAGLPMNNVTGEQLKVYYMGEEIPVYVSTDQSFENEDYIEFFGQKNRGDFDRYLYQDPENEILNPIDTLKSVQINIVPYPQRHHVIFKLDHRSSPRTTIKSRFYDLYRLYCSRAKNL